MNIAPSPAENAVPRPFGRGYASMFAPEKLTVGVYFPIEAFDGPAPAMHNQIELAQQAERLGFAALWARDVPLDDPSFGDLGQIYDPFVWLATIAARTSTIALATGAVILPLHHPIDVAKAVASLDRLSGGRFVFGVASGDRPVEYPAYGRDADLRGELFREAFDYVEALLTRRFPVHASAHYGRLAGGGDLVPKPISPRLPTLVTGQSQQSLDWIAQRSDGWLTYPRDVIQQEQVASRWCEALNRLGQGFKPIAQSLYVDLAADPDTPPGPIHLGVRVGRRGLADLLDDLRSSGINHVALNLKFSRRPVADVLDEIGTEVIPHFSIGAQ
ncbi:TIGR03571 family LLM class oxidoreductase [Rhizobium leguminosarum bv. viciae]|uniref:TIGR03571 family LLM class oxidoreductase n=1 Tax=Rhizobium leguminosarum bv. viciae TaxID=387 RepID=A0A8I2KJJ1_RHILV|nr:LLM class oxidoreductase [Rhizobium leguminosarum]MBY5420933.1 LLM class oxidoreductase [Rhizobium leguminosarum]MBY5427803.1 LLM class oxidoreductase [Rhizobium leguminosarum]MBY5775011.1 LLM class oxidoreductase [Rhizobium leguminosarum]MBY5782007.1 LLM class oxidoreductase [Rhizobium leguminosarum]MBY5795431.1 LLM class oxidoreductase [Rhizobium leguminosarum]